MISRLSAIDLLAPAPPTRQIRTAPVKRAAQWLRPGECVLVGYFVYTAILASTWRLAWTAQALAWAAPPVLAVLGYLEARRGNHTTGVIREWILPGLVFIGYLQVNWFRQPYNTALEYRWVAWDRVILDQWHLRAALESFGVLLPSILEFSYLMIYAVPPICLWILYRARRRSRVDRFLFTLVLGTLTTYALLPHFATEPPRLLFPGQDLPGITNIFRRINIALADAYDISTSVFPSGHVTAAFSAGFGMLLAYPERKRYGAWLLVLAVSIALTTVYGRYHYAVDVAAGLCVSLCAAAVSVVLFGVREWRQQPRIWR